MKLSSSIFSVLLAGAIVSGCAESSGTTPPAATMTAPADGATVSGAVAVSANTSDNVSVAGVQFLLDDQPLGSEDTTAPYSIEWNTTSTTNGSHTLSARARDAANDTTTSTAISVTVSNPVACRTCNTITLTPNGGTGANELVSVGVPFPQGELTNPANFRVVDDQGSEVPIFVKPTLRWHWTDNSIRALKVQFFASMSGGARTFTFTYDTPRNTGADLTEQSYDNGTLVGKATYHVPRVLATLEPTWMCGSRIAGPQKPKGTQTPYETYFEGQFAWAKNTDYNADYSSWLFDRVTAIYKQYVRTGNSEYLKEAFNSYRFYIDHITTTGSFPGGFVMPGKAVEDTKYVYAESVLLHLGLTGDDTQGIDVKVPLMANATWAGGWQPAPGPYTSVSQPYTERSQGIELLTQVAAFELRPDLAATYLSHINSQIGWFSDHQQSNPDGRPYDGSWRHDWNMHESAGWNASDQRRGGSPWMSENIIDGLWHAWLITSDTRIPTMVKGFALDFMENYGWGQDRWFTQGGTTWRHSCNQNGIIPMYWSSSVMTDAQIVEIENSEGWYSDSHTPELALVVGAAYFFSTNPTERQTLRTRMDKIELYFNSACAAISSTTRKFNWNHRGSSVAQWMMDQ